MILEAYTRILHIQMIFEAYTQISYTLSQKQMIFEAYTQILSWPYLILARSR